MKKSEKYKAQERSLIFKILQQNLEILLRKLVPRGKIMLPENKRDRQVFGGFDKIYQVVENEAILSGTVDKEIAFS